MEHVAAASTAKGQGRAPPYHSYANFTTFLRDLNVSGIPPRIDKGAMAGVPDTVKAQLMTGLRFLDLLTGDNEPTPSLRALAAAYGTDGWANALEKVVRRSYADIFNLDLMAVTADHLLDAFSPFASSDEVKRKCQVFFLQAAKEANIPLGPGLQKKGGRGSSGAPTPRKRSKSRREASNGNGPNAPPPPQPTPAGIPASADLVSQLVSKFPAFDPTWPDNIKAAWFEGFGKFMGIATPKSSGGST